MSDMSPGERAFLRLRWLAYDARSRPLALAGLLVLLATIVAMVAAVVGASGSQLGGFREWMYSAWSGFTLDVELAVLLAGVLLAVDSLAAEVFPGQRTMFGLLALVALAGLAANIATAAAWLSQPGLSGLPSSSRSQMWILTIAGFLAPSVVALVSGWIAIDRARSLTNLERNGA